MYKYTHVQGRKKKGKILCWTYIAYIVLNATPQNISLAVVFTPRSIKRFPAIYAFMAVKVYRKERRPLQRRGPHAYLSEMEEILLARPRIINLQPLRIESVSIIVFSMFNAIYFFPFILFFVITQYYR